MPSGSGQKKKKWHLADAMEFLQPWAGSQRKMTGSLSNPMQPSATQPLAENMTQDSEAEITPANESTIESDASKGCEVEFIPKKIKSKSAAEIVAAPMVDFLRAATEKKKSGDSNLENPMLTFFKSLVPDTDVLSPNRKRKFKAEVMATLNRMIDEQDNESLFQSTPSRPLSTSSGGSHYFEHPTTASAISGNYYQEDEYLGTAGPSTGILRIL